MERLSFVLFIVTTAFTVSTVIAQLEADSTTVSAQSCPDACNLKPVRGMRGGKAPFRRWYYDSETKECKKFSYSGQRGGENANRFFTKEICETECGGCGIGIEKDEGNAKDATCNLPLDHGHCNTSAENFPYLRWHYDSEKFACVPFLFVGCGGNENKFTSHEKCKESCDE